MSRCLACAGAELAVALATAAGLAISCMTIAIDPMDRTGQVSGLAAVGFRFALVAIALGTVLAITARGRGFAAVERFACAGLAGLASGFVAGAVALALRGVPYGLNATNGDAGVLITWADRIRAGDGFSGAYPPLQPHLLAWFAQVLDLPTAHAFKVFQIVGVAIAGPLAYASWRLVLRPCAALAVGVVAALPLFEAYRQYPQLVLVILVPLAVRFVGEVRAAPDRDTRALVKTGACFGAAFALLFLMYSGWFLWSAPGLAVALLHAFPWRRGPRRAVILCAAAAGVFALLSARYIASIVAAPAVNDSYFYFDAAVEPAYFAAWKGDLPGVFAGNGMWPLPAELGGVGVFGVLLVVGLGAAIAARHRAAVPVIALLASAWLMRMWTASQMWKTHLVQLWPRTSAEILYCTLVLAGLGAHALATRVSASSLLRARSTRVGVFCAVALLAAMAGSAIGDSYMPRNDGSRGILAYTAQTSPRPNFNQAYGAQLEASSELAWWPPAQALDGRPDSAFSSAEHARDDHGETIELRLPAARLVSKVVLRPAIDGFPRELLIEVWDGSAWRVRVWRRDYEPQTRFVTFAWLPGDVTDRVRIRATRLGKTLDGTYALRLAEIELYSY